jgi:hypothetical protein
MKIAILHGPRDLRIEDRPMDTGNLKPEEIWVQTRISALKIGTDRGNYEGAERVPGAPDYPRWVGDSNLGTCEVSGATSRTSGRRPHRHGQPHQSSTSTQTASIVKVPHGVDDEDFVPAHLYALSALCHKAQFRPGENVAAGWGPGGRRRPRASVRRTNPPAGNSGSPSKWRVKWELTKRF